MDYPKEYYEPIAKANEELAADALLSLREYIGLDVGRSPAMIVMDDVAAIQAEKRMLLGPVVSAMKNINRMNDHELNDAIETGLLHLDPDVERAAGVQPIDKTQELLNRMAQVQIEAAVRNMVDNLLLADRAKALNDAGVTYLGMQLQTGRGEVSYVALCASWGHPPAAPTVH